MYRIIIAVAGAALLAGCSVLGIRSGSEQLRYEVLETVDQSVEIRRYAPRLAVEASVVGDTGADARNRAFRTLFAFISGANRPETDVAMTTPVAVDVEPTKIAMTVPVETITGDSGATTMRFFLPAAYTMATAPQPTDPDVALVELPPATLAVLRFTGWWNDEGLARREQTLLEAIAATRWKVAGPATVVFYDPPWTLPFLRRNEIAVPVVGGADARPTLEVESQTTRK